MSLDRISLAGREDEMRKKKWRKKKGGEDYNIGWGKEKMNERVIISNILNIFTSKNYSIEDLIVIVWNLSHSLLLILFSKMKFESVQ